MDPLPDLHTAMSDRRSYFFKGLLITVIAVAAPLIGLLAFSLWAQREADLVATKASLQARAEQAARSADNALGRIEQVLDFLASRPELQSADPQSCRPFMTGLTAIDPLLSNVGVIDLQGVPLCRSIGNTGTTVNFAERDWFKAAIRSEGRFLSKPYKGMLTGNWQLTMVRPMLDASGKRIALLAVGLDIQTFATRLLSVEGLPDGSVFGIVASDGTVMAVNSASQAWIGRKLPPALHESLLAAKRPTEAPGLDGSDRVLASVPMKHYQLHVGVGVPREVVMAPSETRARNSAAVAATIALAALLVAWIGAQRLSRPVASLTETARAFGSGNLQVTADESLPGEFRILAREFNTALAAVRTSEEARRARAAAEAASQAKSDFLAHMSHEIRTPMNAIIGMTDLALREPLQPKARDYLVKVRQASHSLLGVINDILDFSKIEAGKLDMECVPFALQDVLDRVTAVVGLQARRKEQELLISIAADVPDQVMGDPLRLEQVLVNLCGNAVKFTGPGELVLVSVRREADGALRFGVRDTGPGLTPEQISQLFQPFNQLDASTTRRHGGTGLGLAICRQLVALMGGTIDVRSQPGKGSDFFFTLRQDGCPQCAPQGQPVNARLAGRRVLVVDDNAHSREIFAAELAQLGAEVTLAASAAEALGAAKAAEQPFDVALVDLRLPDGDGFTLVRELRALGDQVRRQVLVTAYGDDEVAREAQTQGLDGCLFKPVGRLLLAETLERVLADQPPAMPVDSETPTVAPAILKGARVLLVEDNEFNQIVAADLLGAVAGMDVTVVSRGHEALQRLEAEDFDLVLMDVQMPDMDGYETTRRLRELPRHGQCPVIAMTAYAMARDRQRCMEAGMNDFITKPVEPAELFAVLSRWVAPRPEAPQVPAAPSLQPTAQTVDTGEGLRRCLGRQDLYDRIVDRFLAGRSGDEAALRQALIESRMEAVALIAHATTSSAGTLGARVLSEIARQLQAAVLEESGRAAIETLINAFIEEHRRVIAELQRYVGLRMESTS